MLVKVFHQRETVCCIIDLFILKSCGNTKTVADQAIDLFVHGESYDCGGVARA